MSGFDNGEVSVEVVQEMRAMAQRNADVPELVEHLHNRLGLKGEMALIPMLAYFKSAFCLSLREALPLREWLASQDRSEVDSILVPAMQSKKEHWQSPRLQRA